KDCVTCSPSKAKEAKRRSIGGRTGRAAPGSRPSCISNARSQPTETRSTPRSTPPSPTASSNPPTPRSGYSPASRSGSTDTNHLSRSRCPPSAHTHPDFPAEHDPRKRQESAITADRLAPSRRDTRDVSGIVDPTPIVAERIATELRPLREELTNAVDAKE